MSSTTANKKEIVDFLWEWAETNGDWSKLLIEKVVATENNLSKTDRALVFDYFIQKLKLKSGLPSLSISKPSYTPTNKKIEIDNLSNITGVNKLAKNQTMKFSKNITVVYGENGTGKTGYGRILKSLGFSYDTNDTIHPNIYTTKEPTSADIAYTSNGVNNTFNWDGANKNTEYFSF